VLQVHTSLNEDFFLCDNPLFFLHIQSKNNRSKNGKKGCQFMGKTICCLMIFSFLILPGHSQSSDLPHQLTAAELLLLPGYQPPLYSDALTDPPPYPVRTMAEWEELQGIMVTWTNFQYILSQIIDYAQDECRVYVVCSDSNSVRNFLNSQGIPIQNIHFILANFNSIWIRDYGPWTVYSIPGDTLGIVDWIYNRPRPYDDLIPGVFANLINAPLYATTTAPNNLIHSGGNFMSDGHHTAFSSKLILQENPGKTEAQIDTIMKKFMGIQRYIKMDVLPYDVIHHIDMHMKLLDEETLLVGEYPPGISDGPQIEANLNYLLANFKTCYGRDFRVVRIPMPPDQYGRYPSSGGDYRTYTNSIIINQTVIVPTYQLQYDTTAFRIYREAMPGYRIVGINCNSIIPSLGAIHCIVKEVGAYEPIHISHAPLLSVRDTLQSYPIITRIQTSSGIQQAELYWSVDTTQGYAAIPMTPTFNDSFIAEIPRQPGYNQIFYFIAARSNSGKLITRPLTAPAGYFTLNIEAVSGLDELPKSISQSPTLYPNYPNPFNPVTIISWQLVASSMVNLTVYNSSGQKIVELVNGNKPAGSHKVEFHAAGLASGVYLYQLKVISPANHHREQVFSRKMLLLK
jgi:agmatine/peptidylarginine deiminase